MDYIIDGKVIPVASLSPSEIQSLTLLGAKPGVPFTSSTKNVFQQSAPVLGAVGGGIIGGLAAGPGGAVAGASLGYAGGNALGGGSGSASTPYNTAAAGAAQAKVEANKLSELQWQRQMEGLERALGASRPSQSLYDRIYGTSTPSQQGLAPPGAGGAGPAPSPGGYMNAMSQSRATANSLGRSLGYTPTPPTPGIGLNNTPQSLRPPPYLQQATDPAAPRAAGAIDFSKYLAQLQSQNGIG